MPPPPPPPLVLNNKKNSEKNKKDENENNKEKEKEKVKYIGLKNQGATCYLNSLIQTLFMTPEFRYEILKWNYDPSLNGEAKDCIPLQLQKLFFHLQEPIRKTEETKSLTKSFQWNTNEVYVQQDIQELCRVLFEAIEISIFLSGEDNNFLKNLYEGKTSSVIKCLECNNKSINTDTYMDLSLPIMNIFEGIHNKSLEMALMNFIKPEKLEGDNKYFCEKCNKKVEAEKFSQFTSFPKIFFLQLGRFYYDFETDRRQKLSDRVPFPLILNCNKYLKEYKDIIYNEKESEDDEYCLDDSEEKIKKYFEEGDNVYELFSIVIQSGSANGGHYYAYIKSFEDQKWYIFNDGSVSLMDKKIIIDIFGEKFDGKNNKSKSSSSSTAYYLSYRKMRNPNDKNNNDKILKIEDMKISDNLRELCKDEDLIIIEKEKEEEEKRKYAKMGVDPTKKITVYIYTEIIEEKHNNTNNKDQREKGNKKESDDEEELNEEIKYDVKIVNLIGKDTYETLLKEIYKIYNFNEEIQKIIKIREFDSKHKKVKEYLEIEKNEFVGKIFKNDSSIFIQFPINERGDYPIYEPFKIHVYIIKYPDNKDIKDDDTSIDNLPKKKISINTSDTLDMLTKKICEKIGYKYEEKNINIIKKISSFNSVSYYEINRKELYGEKSIAMELILNNTELFVEKLNEGEQSKWNKYLDKFKPKVTITFNNINPAIDQKELMIFSSRDEKMINIKKEIINVLNNPLEYNMNNIIMKEKNKTGKEIIDLNTKLDSYFIFDNFEIYIELGTPLKMTEKELIILFCEYDYEKFNFYPYKFTMINSKLIVDENSKIKDIKKLILEKNLEKFPEIQKKITQNQNSKIIIRKINGNCPTKIYYDEQIIKKIIEEDFDLCHNIRLCMQLIPNNLLDEENICENNELNIKNSIELSMRYFDFSTWNLTEPMEIIIKDNLSFDKLCDIILKHYPYLEKKENIQIITLNGGYKTYLDTMLKFKPYSLMDSLDSTIDKYPLFIKNDGKMLIIKDKRIEAIEPSDDIKKYGFEPLEEKGFDKIDKNVINNSKNNRSNSTGKVKKMIALFNEGEFDPANRVHKDPNQKKSGPRAKEKGVTIKIKMLEKEEDNKKEVKEEKEEKNIENKDNTDNKINKDNNNVNGEKLKENNEKDKKKNENEENKVDEINESEEFEPLI